MSIAHKLRLGLIGCGHRGQEHVRAALATGLYEFTAVADLDEKRRAELAARHAPRRQYGDFRALLEGRAGIDVLHLCTQPTLRTPAVRAALAAGVKALVVEKPMALDYSEAAALAGLCREAGVLLVVNHQKRGMAEWLALREAVLSGKLGQVSLLRSSCYGNLLNQGTHMFDMAFHVLGEPKAKWLLGACDARVNEATMHPAPRNALALVEYDNGVRGSFTIGEDSPAYPNSRVPWFHCNIEILGSEGRAEAVLDQGFRRWNRAGELIESFEARWDEKNQGAGQERLSRDVAAALADPSFQHMQRAESALKGFALMEATCRSALSGKVIELPLEAGEDALAKWSRRKTEARTAAPAGA